MAKLKITPKAVYAPTLWQKVQMYFLSNPNPVWWLKYLKNNTPRHVPYLQQEWNWSCVMLWLCGMIAYNTDIKFTSEEVLQMAEDANATNGAFAWQVSELLTQAFNLSRTRFSNFFDKDAQKILDLWYALGISTQFPLSFYIDGMKDGKVDTEYKKSSKNSKEMNQTVIHFMYIKKVDGNRYIVVNNWKDKSLQGLKNEYEVDINKLRESGLMYRDCYFLA
jgi:hypothetical protein